MNGFTTALSDRAVLRLTGKDTLKFLQGLLTRDMNKLSDTQALYGLMLTPQGKFLYDFFIVKDGDALLLDVDAAKKAEIISKLTMYKLRSDVQIQDTDYHVHAACGEEVFTLFDGDRTPGKVKKIDSGTAYIDPRTSTMFARMIDCHPERSEGSQANGFFATLRMTEGTLTDYDSVRIHHCVPDVRNDMISEKVFPLHFRMDELNAVDFDKGCYVGQEVTTRSKHRGAIRKSIYTVKGKEKLPEPGTTITTEGKAVGELLSIQDDIALALLEKEAAEGKLMAGTVALRVILH